MNPNFKPHMITNKLLKACEEQVQKYFGEREMNMVCGVCEATEGAWNRNCKACPLSNNGDYCSCTNDSTFIHQGRRLGATKKQLLVRGYRLIEIMDKHGITIYDVKVKP